MKNYDDKYGKRSPIRQTKTLKRKLLKKSPDSDFEARRGRVVSLIGKTAIVLEFSEANAAAPGEIVEKYYECVIAGALRTGNEDATLVAVGDEVGFITSVNNATASGLPAGMVVSVAERRSFLSRTANLYSHMQHVIAANVDSLLIIMSAAMPFYNRRLIDRYLIASQIGVIEPALCINKMDLIEEPEIILEDLEIYTSLGVKVFYVSVLENRGMVELRDYVRDRTTVLSGPSGSGKSSILNALIGDEVQAVSEISERTTKGRHTTSSARLFELPDGGEVIDSPGIREFGLWGADRENLPLMFPDFYPYQLDCKYKPCTHTHEPECKVLDALEQGKIDVQRYESYLNIIDTLPEPSAFK
ncbi:MAG: ribosome small subunit-dependent GTPase A [Chloroflexota bacterium]